MNDETYDNSQFVKWEPTIRTVQNYYQRSNKWIYTVKVYIITLEIPLFQCITGI